VVGSLDLLGLVLVEHDVHRAIVAPGHEDSEDVLEVIRVVKSLGMKVSVLPRLFEVVGSSVEFDDVHGAMLLGVRRFGLTKSSRMMKRAMDIAGSAAILLVTLPLFALVAVAIKATSPGPVFFRQTRIGRHGSAFRIFKFRTMVEGADRQRESLRHLNEVDGGLFKITDDPRITRVGAYLRRTSLDELPQLLNVLRGEMSLVGPRPLVPDEDRLVEGWHRGRLLETPGITGPWQIFGSARIPLHEMVKIDYLYWANWSLWGDVMILLRTVPYAISRRGL
jgi:exopolysaccharide biosynthesis polyprenyl glycosylphosphotransferase